MRSLKECVMAATQANTTGMGNPSFPNGTTPGSEPIVMSVFKRKKKKQNKKPED